MKVKDYFYSQKEFTLIYHSGKETYQTIFDEANISDYYTDYYISHNDSSNKGIDKIYQFVKKYTIQKKWKWIRKYFSKTQLSVLDFGCGTADFLNYGKNRNHHVIGIEPNKSARNLAHAKGIDVISSIKELSNKTYDVITLWHVLEHVSNYDEIIKLLVEKLDANGILILALPNYKSYDAKYYKNYWAAWDVPRHLWHFSKKSINILAKNNNLKVEKIKPLVFDSFYISMISQKYKTGKSNFVISFLIGFISNIIGFFTKNYSSHTYFLRKQSK